ncbi:MAG: hypothetical protein U0289_06670 [Cyclobacteriaceae bacterium]|jgi:hypothetical protein|nr:hypothetical protein [Cytophagales bacterium]HNP77782.1 hypothetical protein [Cyclobacteriaceae bacterium]
MDKKSLNTLKGTLIVPAGLAIVLAPFSLWMEWNGMTAIFFWFMLTPGLALYLPTLVPGNKSHWAESVTGLIIFYAFMVFMIYQQFQTDLFSVMLVSCVINVILVSVIAWMNKPAAQSQH